MLFFPFYLLRKFTSKIAAPASSAQVSGVRYSFLSGYVYTIAESYHCIIRVRL